MEANMQKLTQHFQKRWIDSGLMDGATVVICRKDGVVYRQHFGDNKPDSLYVCYSLTKIVTSVACLQLQEAGKLHLDDPVSKYLPAFRKPRRPGPAGETPDITIRHCLNHTSGLSYLLGLVHPQALWEPIERNELKNRSMLANHAERVAHMAEQALLFPPGTRFNYSEAHALAASIIEVVSGQPFHQYLRQRLFAPLGMDEVTFLPSAAQAARIPSFYNDLADLDHPYPALLLRVLRLFFSRMPAWPKDLFNQQELITGDAGLKGTVDGWVALNRALLNGGELPGGARVLTEASVREMSRSSLPAGAELAAPFAVGAAPGDETRHRPQRRLDAVARHVVGAAAAEAPAFGVARVGGALPYRTVNSYPGQTFGLGVAIVEEPVRAGLHPKAKGTCWWQGLASTYFAFNPDTDIGVLVFAQRINCITRQQALADVINAAHEMLL